jgi:thiol-disulfide isomerase/thioredoxin
MAQVNKPITMKKLAAGAGVLAAAVFFANLLFSPPPITQLDARAMRAITSEGTFKTVQGDGSRAIHVFLSTECAYCRKIEPELGQLENVTVYRHLLPGHTEVGRLSAIDVWCSTSPIAAWKAIALGLAVRPAKCDASVLDRNLALATRLGLTMTPSIVYDDGHVSAGMLSSREIAERVARSAKR